MPDATADLSDLALEGDDASAAAPAAPSTGKKLVLLDGNSLLYRGFFAMRALTTSAGQPTNAVFSFTMMLLTLLQEQKPDVMVCAWDAQGKKTFRHEEYKEYKGTRQSAPTELVEQGPIAREMVQAFHIPTVEAPGYEADDIIGTLAKRGREQGYEVLIVTGDLDALQLVEPGVRVMTTVKGVTDTVIYDEAAVLKRYGLRPDQLADYRALKGDTSDNIPGVPGVGEKTASQLLQQYGTVEELIHKVDEIKQAKLQASLVGATEQMVLSKRLATILRDVSLEGVDLPALDAEPHQPEWDKVRALFERLEFRTLLRRLPKDGANGEDKNGASPAPAADAGPDLNAEDYDPFADDGQDASAPAPAVMVEAPADYRDVDPADAIALREMADAVQRAHRVGLRLHTSGEGLLDAHLLGVALATGGGTVFYVPVRTEPPAADEAPKPPADPNAIASLFDEPATAQESLPAPSGEAAGGVTIPAELVALLEEPKVAKVSHESKSDIAVLKRAGVDLQGVVFDTELAAYLLNAGRRAAFPLAEVAADYAGRELHVLDKKERKAMEPGDIAAHEKQQTLKAADALLATMGVQEPRLAAEGLTKVMEELDLPISPIVAEMELTGIAVDVPTLNRMAASLQGQVEGLEKEIYQLAGTEFTIGSTKQLQEVLYDKLKIPATKKTKTGYSTDADTLEELAPQYPIVGKILTHRGLVKLKNTYADAMPLLVRPDTGRIHTSLNQTVASTGRLSCLPAGTLVNTRRGLVGIETVRPGECIRTPYGPRRVTAWEATGDKPVVRISLANGIVLRCSPEHRIRSRGEWLRADALKVGDPVYMSFTEGLFGDTTAIHLEPTAAYRTHKTPDLPVEWTPQLAELIGYCIADGHIVRSNYNNKPSKVVLAFGWDEEDLIEHFAASIRALFGKSAVRRNTRSCPVLEVSSADVAGAFCQLGAGHMSHHIAVPEGMRVAPEAVVAAFLRGYFEGDGCVAPEYGISVRSVSRRMLEDVQQLLTLFGIPSGIVNGGTDPRGYAPRHTLRVLGDRSKKTFHDRIGFISDRKRRSCAETAAMPRSKSGGECLTIPDTFDATSIQPPLYDALRDADGHVPQAAVVFMSKMRRGAGSVALSRAEWMVKHVGTETDYGAATFLTEAVEAQYYEVAVTNIADDPPIPMYDIAVDDVAQYMAQGIVVHNSSNPNLQNIPVRTEIGREIRRAFVAPDGNVLVSADYSQIELRIFAHVTNDPALVEAFESGEDIHKYTAGKMYNVPVAEVTNDMRRAAKTVNYAVIYGISEFALGRRLGISMTAAKELKTSYFERFPGVREYLDQTVASAREKGYVQTLFGRRRYIPDINSRVFQFRQAAERAAANMPIQGSSADIMKLAMQAVYDMLRAEKFRARMLLQVHDELLFEAPPEEVQTLAARVREKMSGVYPLRVALEADVKTGKTWADVTPVADMAAPLEGLESS